MLITITPLSLIVATALFGGHSRPVEDAPSVPDTASRATCHDVLPSVLALFSADSLRRDLYILASDSMRGREAGTADELRAAAWMAKRAREEGLQPAGQDGSYFQLFSIRRARLASTSAIRIGERALAMPREAVVVTPEEAHLDAPIVFVGAGRAAELAGRDIRDQVVAAVLTPPEGAPPVGAALSARRYTMLAVRERAAFLIKQGARAVVLVSDSVADGEFENIAVGWARGEWANTTAAPDSGARPPVIWLRRSALALVRGSASAPPRLTAELSIERFVVPSVNVVATVRGARTSPARDSYVLYSAHIDGLGVRFPWAGDSIWNGADDNGSTSVALLAIGKAFAAHPGSASVLLVWHGAEEPGLLGSSWYATHPTVPRSSILAVLNGDMIGRNSPDSAALLGSQPPNRTSSALVDAALRANAAIGHFVIDSSWDRPTHPEGFFRRSDHWPYVRAGVPAIYFSTLLHADYHTPFDEASRVDYTKLTRMARWMYAAGWAVACDPGMLKA